MSSTISGSPRIRPNGICSRFWPSKRGFDLWVSGQTLNFSASGGTNGRSLCFCFGPTSGPRQSRCELRGSSKLHRSQTLAKDIIVKVISWNQVQEGNVTAQAKRSQANKSQRAGGQAQIYTFYEPNLNQQQAQKWANAKAEDITRHERVITGKLPGDNLLTNRSLIKLVGTGTDWDQVYFVDSVTRRMNFKDGYSMEFRAKNHSPQSTV